VTLVGAEGIFAAIIANSGENSLVPAIFIAAILNLYVAPVLNSNIVKEVPPA
jgi:hypothetical protein